MPGGAEADRAARVTAFACTDIQGSTGLWERMGRAFGPVLERHNAILRAAIATHAGREIGTEGDAFVVAFDRASDAVRFAVAAQEALHAEPWPPETGGILVRIGVHVGEAIAAADSSTGRVDWRGPALARAKAVASAAHGGQILVSGAARAAADGFAFADLGEHRLRDAVSPERLWQALPPSLPPRSFPPPRTLSALPTNLPVSPTSFVGRAREKKDVLDLLSRGAGILTVSGPPGIGKTRLVLEAAGAALPHFRGGAWFVELTEAREAGELAAAVARAMGISTGGAASAVAAVGAALELREPTLLVLDAFEHAVAHAPATVGEWRRRAPQVSFLVASCELLGLPGEQELPLAPLDAAGPDADALRLFVERAREADHRFTLSPENDADVRAIVAELEGIPLALELAAARLRIMKPAQLRQKLTQRFQLLRSTRTDLPANRRTLEGAVEWSWSLLAEWERAAFAQLCVFRGGFFLEAAEAVLDLSAFPDAPMAMDAVQRLREKSFLRTEETPYETRFTMYRTLREFGEARLGEEAGDAARQRLGEWCLAYFARWDDAARSALPAEALDRAEYEMANVHEATLGLLRASRTDDAAALLRRVYLFLVMRGLAQDLAPSLEVVHAALPPGAGRARAWTTVAVGYARKATGALDAALALATEAESSARSCGDEDSRAWALLLRADVLGSLGRADELLSDTAEVLSLPIASRIPWFAARARLLEATVLASRGRRAEAIVHLRACAEAARHSGDAPTLAELLDLLAPYLFQEGERDAAIAATREMETLARSFGNFSRVGSALSRRGHYLAQLGDIRGALACLEEAESLLRREGRRDRLAFTLRIRGNLHRRRAEFDQALRCYAEAERLERAAGNLDSIASICRGRGHLFIQRGQIDEAEKDYLEAADIARRLNDRQGELASLSDASNVAQARGDDAALLKIHTRGEALARELGEFGNIAAHLRGRAAILTSSGKAEEALSLLDEAAVIQQRQPLPIEEAHLLLTRATALLKLGRHVEARDAAQGSIDAYERGGSPIRVSTITLCAVIVECEAALGHPEAARAAAEKGLAVLGPLGGEAANATPFLRRTIGMLRATVGGATPASGT